MTTRLASYDLIRKIAAGGMAEIFLARQWGEGGFFRDVVIKRLFPHLAEHKRQLRMFQDEARLLSELAHPNIPQVYDIGLADGYWYIAMEYVEGLTTTFSTLSLNQRSTVISGAFTYIHDNVGSVLRGGMPRTDDTGRDLSDRGRQGQLEGVTASVSLNQTLSPVTTFVTGYQLVHNWGYLQNPYRRARVGGGLVAEDHPDQRTRHTLWGRLAHFFPETRTAVHLMYRAYLDDWDVSALNPEVRVYQLIGDSVVVRLRYRYHDQVDSFFFRTEYSGTEDFVTADPKMSNFFSHLFGVQLRVGLDFLSRTPLSFLERAWVDLSFNYWHQTSTFGDAILAQAGLRAPF